MKSTRRFALSVLVAASAIATAQAAVTADEAKALGNNLTPVGAEKAGNAAGTIPAWTGGLTTPPAGFKAGEEDGHHLQNRSGSDVLLLEVGTRVTGDGAHYPGIDLVHPADGIPALYTHLDGTPYADIRMRGPGK